MIGTASPLLKHSAAGKVWCLILKSMVSNTVQACEMVALCNYESGSANYSNDLAIFLAFFAAQLPEQCFKIDVDKRQTLSYVLNMKIFQWNTDKNEWLKKHRGVCFEQIVILMEHEDILDVIEHPNQDAYKGQMIAIIRIDDYAYLVPYLEEGDDIFLKTIIPSRKATNKYLREKK